MTPKGRSFAFGYDFIITSKLKRTCFLDKCILKRMRMKLLQEIKIIPSFLFLSPTFSWKVSGKEGYTTCEHCFFSPSSIRVLWSLREAGSTGKQIYLTKWFKFFWLHCRFAFEWTGCECMGPKELLGIFWHNNHNRMWTICWLHSLNQKNTLCYSL